MACVPARLWISAPTGQRKPRETPPDVSRQIHSIQLRLFIQITHQQWAPHSQEVHKHFYITEGLTRLWTCSKEQMINASSSSRSGWCYQFIFLLYFSFWNSRNIFPVDWKVFMSRQMEKILLTLNCSSLRELLWQGGAPITRNSSCVLFTKRPKAARFHWNNFVSVMKKLLASCLFSHLLPPKYDIFIAMALMLLRAVTACSVTVKPLNYYLHASVWESLLWHVSAQQLHNTDTTELLDDALIGFRF